MKKQEPLLLRRNTKKKKKNCIGTMVTQKSGLSLKIKFILT